MNRRGFIATIIAATAAPSIVRASSLMPGKVWTPQTFKVTERYGVLTADPRGFGMAPVKREGARITYDPGYQYAWVDESRYPHAKVVGRGGGLKLIQIDV